jgi:cytochrome c-type biogenesis protein CcmH/NrfG
VGQAGNEPDAVAREKLLSKAIAKVNSLLEMYQTDQESWMMLANLYLKTNNLSSAQFCFEELILYNPFNAIFFQRYAEVLYTVSLQWPPHQISLLMHIVFKVVWLCPTTKVLLSVW